MCVCVCLRAYIYVYACSSIYIYICLFRHLYICILLFHSFDCDHGGALPLVEKIVASSYSL